MLPLFSAIDDDRDKHFIKSRTLMGDIRHYRFPVRPSGKLGNSLRGFRFGDQIEQQTAAKLLAGTCARSDQPLSTFLAALVAVAGNRARPISAKFCWAAKIAFTMTNGSGSVRARSRSSLTTPLSDPKTVRCLVPVGVEFAPELLGQWPHLRPVLGGKSYFLARSAANCASSSRMRSSFCSRIRACPSAIISGV